MAPAFDIPLASLRAHQEFLDVAANNVANVNTDGFKASDAHRATGPGGRGTRTSATPRDHRQGPIRMTGKPLDIAVKGNGFFSVRRGDGSVAFTRTGAFFVDGDGNLVTAGGGLVDPPVRVPPNAQAVRVSENGTVTAILPGGETREVGQVLLTTFPNPAGLEALGGNLFRPTENSGGGNRTAPGVGGAGTLVSGGLEGSNVDLAEQMIHLIVGSRGFEAQTAVVRTEDEIQRTILDLKR